MPEISARSLAVIIPLLSDKILEIRREIKNMESKADNLTEDESHYLVGFEEMLTKHELTIADLKEKYESELRKGIQLPSYQELIGLQVLEETSSLAN